jgi:putative holliday junction resolvase
LNWAGNFSMKRTFAAMSRILAIDFGMKRTGLAISDPLKMIANGLDTVPTVELMGRLHAICKEKPFDCVVVGLPKRMDGSESAIEQNIKLFVESLAKEFPDLRIDRLDERFTSKIAMQTMLAMGTKRSDRREKGNVDKISATLLLQEYLNKS